MVNVNTPCNTLFIAISIQGHPTLKMVNEGGRGSKMSLGQGGVQRCPWVREGFRDVLGPGRGSKMSLGQGGV